MQTEVNYENIQYLKLNSTLMKDNNLYEFEERRVRCLIIKKVVSKSKVKNSELRYYIRIRRRFENENHKCLPV